MAKLISIISTKGSVGKTTLLIHIAGYLAEQGNKVLLINADSQQSLSRFFNYKALDANIAHSGFGKFFVGEKSAQEVIQQTANHDNIDIIVNDDPKKWLVAKFLRYNTGAVYQLATMLKPLREQYDFIFIDTEGTDGRDHDGNSIQNAALLAEPDLVLSVTKTKLQFAMEALRVVDVYKQAIKAYKFIDKLDVNPPLKFIVNEHDRGLNTAQVVLDELRESFALEAFEDAELLNTIVPFKRKFFENYYHDKTFMHQYKDPNKHDHLDVVIKALCEELFPEIISEDLQENKAV